MKFLCIDSDGEGMGVDICMRAQDWGHEVRYWLPPHKTGERLKYGDGFVIKTKDWEAEMDWAELILVVGNSQYRDKLDRYFGKGYPIFGTNSKAAALELDRGAGQELLERCGVRVPPYQVVGSVEEAIGVIKESDMAYAMKPWGGEADKAMTYVASTPDDAIFTLERWKKLGLFKGQLMLQEKVEGIEVGISGMFGPGGWCQAIEESFEHKKFLAGDLGCNTGEMGTVIRHVLKSKLFDEVLEPLTDYLHQVNFVGDCSVNCMVDSRGRPMPLEFTMRLGWPDFCIRQALIRGDPIQWMKDLLAGEDSFRVSSRIAVGVLLAHGDFPTNHDIEGTWSEFPVYGISDKNQEQLHYQQMMEGPAPFLIDGKVKRIQNPLTAGNYVMVVTGTGESVSQAAERAYLAAGEIKLPSNLMFRNDIGKRLEAELPKLKNQGFVTGMRY
jgi:phosphoribosylamine--glycine ligase